LELVTRARDILGGGPLVETEPSKEIALARVVRPGDRPAGAHRQETRTGGRNRTRPRWSNVIALCPFFARPRAGP
jgi:hypothetical protein